MTANGVDGRVIRGRQLRSPFAIHSVHRSPHASPDGSEPWTLYHAKTSTAPGWDRVVRAQRFSWAPDGAPVFGTPAGNGTALARPAGECQ